MARIRGDWTGHDWKVMARIGMVNKFLRERNGYVRPGADRQPQEPSGRESKGMAANGVDWIG